MPSADSQPEHLSDRRSARRRRLVLGLLAGLATVVAAPAQEPPPATATPAGDGAVELAFSGSAGVSWVLVPVVVRDGDGIVHGLEAADFRLTVDGREVPIASFDAGSDAAVSLIVLQDLSGSMGNGGKLAASREVVRHLLDDLRPWDEAAIAVFASGSTRVEVPFTADREALAEAVASWQAYGTTALHDAVAWLPELDLEGRHDKRAALLITDGVDNASVLAPDAARRMVREARLPVYVMALHGRRAAATRQPAADDVVLASTLLERLARATGGRYHGIADPDELKEAIAALADDLRYEVVLGFPSHLAGPVAERAIVVELVGGKGRRGWEVRHRGSYQGTAPAAW